MKTVSAESVAKGYLLCEEGKAALKGTVENVWSMLVLFVQPSINGTNREVVDAYLGQSVEVEMVRLQGGKKSKPGAYRSAKSVVLKAIEGGVPLLDADGNPRGKTAVEKDIKETATPEERLARMLKSAVKAVTEDGTGINADALACIAALASAAGIK